MADQLQLRGGTTSEHSTFTGALREVTVDTDKDTVVVHDGSTAGGHPLAKQNLSNVPAGTITSTMIADGTIVNADVNASAAIAGTKISPDFGSQTISTTGIVSHALGTAGAPTLTFTGDTNTGIYSPGADQVAVATNGTGRLVINSSGTSTFSGTSDGVVQLTTTDSRGAFIRFGQAGSYHNMVGCADGITSGDKEDLGVRAADNIIFAAGGSTERLRITSAGLVGIGTSSPHATFQVHDGAFVLSKPASGSERNWRILSSDVAAGDFAIQQSTTTGGTTYSSKLQISASGNVGIGTTSPSEVLTVSKSEAADAFPLHIENSRNYGWGVGLKLRQPLANSGSIIDSGAIVSDFESVNSSTLEFYNCTSGSLTEKARIDSSGRLLVGTATVRNIGYPVTFNSLFESTEYGGLAVVTNNVGADGSYISLAKTRGTAVGSSTIVQSDDILGRILFSGADGTDVESRGAQIECRVDGTPGANDMPGRLVFSTTLDGASSPTERMRIPSSGGLLINSVSRVDAGLVTIRFNGAIEKGLVLDDANPANTRNFIAFDINSTTQIGRIQNNNNTGVTYATSSDYRLKENVTPVTDGITRLQQLKPSRFNFIADPVHTVDGFLAHEAQAVVPECVTGEKDEVDADGKPVYQGIDQSKLVPLLTAALQEAIGEIESLKARVAALESA